MIIGQLFNSYDDAEKVGKALEDAGRKDFNLFSDIEDNYYIGIEINHPIEYNTTNLAKLELAGLLDNFYSFVSVY
jgi:hypothetical protein